MKLDCEHRIFSTREEWLNERMKYLCGSDSACVIGIGFKSNVELWEEKVLGKVNKVTESQETLMKKGSENEPLSREQWAIDTGHRVLDGTNILFINTDILDKNGKPFMAATLDAIGEDEKGIYDIELKRGERLSVYKDGLPPKYRCQMIKQMIVTGIKRAVLSARIVWFENDTLIRHVTEKTFVLNADEEDVKYDMERLIEAEKHFWNDFVLTKKRPPLLLPSI